MRIIIIAMLMYAAIKMCLPGAQFLWSQARSTTTYTTLDQFKQLTSDKCSFDALPETLNPLAFQLADWLESLKQLKTVLWANQLQLFKLTSIGLVAGVPNLNFKLAVTVALVVVRWLELNLELDYGFDLAVVVSALILRALHD